jgi:hyaluronan synthase
VIGRNRPARGIGLAATLLFMALFVSYVVWTMHNWFGQPGTWFLSVFFGLFATVTLANIASGLRWRSFTHLPVPDARVVALVPVYEEKQERVHAVVRSLLDQTRPPEHIYVMDDGSEVPLVGFDDPRVTWLRQENAGKRHAQVNMLHQFDRDDYDLILTVDSDSVFDLDAVEHLMRAFSRDKVQAATAMIYTANWRHNIMTRFTDINLQISTLQMRMLRSWMGIVSPTSGAIAMYRPWVMWDNIDDYLTSGSIGDDRRLSFYALLKGEVITVNEAACETHLPETPRGIFKQRTRWSKSAWLGLPFVLTNMRPWFVAWYSYPLLFQLVFPFSVLVLSFIWIAYGVPTLMFGVTFWFVTSFCMAGAAYAQRPTMSLRDKAIQMGLATLYPVWGLFLLRAASYKALLTIHDQGWGTRGADAPEPEDAGAVAKIDAEVVALDDLLRKAEPVSA